MDYSVVVIVVAVFLVFVYLAIGWMDPFQDDDPFGLGDEE